MLNIAQINWKSKIMSSKGVTSSVKGPQSIVESLLSIVDTAFLIVVCISHSRFSHSLFALHHTNFLYFYFGKMSKRGMFF